MVETSRFASGSQPSSLYDLCFQKEKNLDPSENMTKNHCFCRPIFLLPASLQPLLPLFGSWYAAAKTLFMQPSMCCSVLCLHSSLLPHLSQLLGTSKPVLLSQPGQLAIISLEVDFSGLSFADCCLYFTSIWRQQIGKFQAEFQYCSLALHQIRCSTNIFNDFYLPNFQN